MHKIIDFIRKMARSIRLSAIYIFYGLKSADKVIVGSDTASNNSNGGTIEVTDEADSVYKDLLKGEITQEVMELRHEMYYSERESHKYRYIGNGVVEKRNDIFDKRFEGIENEDNLEILLVQINNEDTGGVKEALEIGNWREFDLKIERNFIPKFRIEEFVNKLVVKKLDDTHVMLDMYTTQYKDKYNVRNTLFVIEVEKIYMGDTDTTTLAFDNLSFVTRKSWGVPDLVKYSYKSITFDNIIRYNGDYILKFIAEIDVNGEDILDEFYNEEAARKNREHERRKNKATTDFFVPKTTEKSYTKETPEDILNLFK